MGDICWLHGMADQLAAAAMKPAKRGKGSP
jgi:hypothetical protein